MLTLINKKNTLQIVYAFSLSEAVGIKALVRQLVVALFSSYRCRLCPETGRKCDKANGSNKSRGWKVCPEDTKHLQEHRDLVQNGGGIR